MIIPPKLKPGSHIRVVAPSLSLSIVSKENIEIAESRLKEMGFTVSYGENVFENNTCNSSSIDSRISDILMC